MTLNSVKIMPEAGFAPYRKLDIGVLGAVPLIETYTKEEQTTEVDNDNDGDFSSTISQKKQMQKAYLKSKDF